MIHFIGDFALQTRKMGLNKGKSIMWLSMHVGVYLITLLFFGIIFNNYIVGDGSLVPIVEWSLLNGVLHWLTDFTTSRLSGYSYNNMLKYKDNNEVKEHKWQYLFWLIIGFDQLIHSVTLLLTYYYCFV